VKHPEHIKDVARAFAWTVKNCEKWGGRPDQIFLAGHSAGGHLVSLLATDESYLKAEGLKLSDIKGVMAISGVYRIPEIHLSLGRDDKADKASLTIGDADSIPDLRASITKRRRAKETASAGHSFDFHVNPFSVVFGKDPKTLKEASPLTHVKPGLPPFLVVYANHDLCTLREMAEDFHLALKDKKCACELLKIEHRTHRSVIFNATTLDDPVAGAMLDFIHQHAR